MNQEKRNILEKIENLKYTIKHQKKMYNRIGLEKSINIMKELKIKLKELKG